METGFTFGWFVVSTLLARILGVCAYRIILREPWPLMDRIGLSLPGAAVGTFAGASLALAFELERRRCFVVAVLAGIAASVSFQRRGFLGSFDDLFWL